MSVFDKLLDSIKLNDDDYDEDNYLDEDLMDDEEGDFFDDDPMDDKPKKKFFEKFGRKKEDDLADADTHQFIRRNSSRNSVVRKRMIWLTQILPLTKNLYIQQHQRLLPRLLRNSQLRSSAL